MSFTLRTPHLEIVCCRDDQTSNRYYSKWQNRCRSRDVGILRFPNPKEKGDNPSEEDVYDEKSSGLYQIIGIRHDFLFGDAFEHTMKLEVIRDSTEKK